MMMVMMIVEGGAFTADPTIGTKTRIQGGRILAGLARQIGGPAGKKRSGAV